MLLHLLADLKSDDEDTSWLEKLGKLKSHPEIISPQPPETAVRFSRVGNFKRRRTGVTRYHHVVIK